VTVGAIRRKQGGLLGHIGIHYITKEFLVKKATFCLYILAVSVPFSAVAHAQATRTWVSGVGDDANPCSRTAPCKTFAGAISKTARGGEIDALDPGGFGAVTITKAITIDGGGQVASVLASGTNGIVVPAGVNDVVTIRNLSINGAGTGIDGIRFASGKGLHLENCTISGFTQNGVNINPTSVPSTGAQVTLVNVMSRDNAMNGLSVIGAGSRVSVTIDKSHFEANGGDGVVAADFTRLVVRDSEASGNGAVGFIAQANAGDTIVNIANSTAGNNVSTGIQAGGGTAVSVVRLTGVSILSNGVNGLAVGTNGSIVSFGGNYNSGSGSPTSNLAPQ
jgi:hypothetical protein